LWDLRSPDHGFDGSDAWARIAYRVSNVIAIYRKNLEGRYVATRR
jgi:hypothetical protein